MIPANMIQERLGRHSEQDILQFFQITYTGNLLPCLRITEHKVAETKVIRNDTPQVDVHFLGVLVDKTSAILCCIRSVL